MGIILTCGSLVLGIPERERVLKTTVKRTEWLICIMIGAMIIYAVWNTAAVRLHLIQAENERIMLTEKIAAVTAENRRLEQEIEDADDAAVIEQVARTKLGLVKPGEIIFRVIKPESRERE